MLVFTTHAGIYDSCWYLRSMMLVLMIHAGIYEARWYLRFMLVFVIHAGMMLASYYIVIPVYNYVLTRVWSIIKWPSAVWNFHVLVYVAYVLTKIIIIMKI